MAELAALIDTYAAGPKTLRQAVAGMSRQQLTSRPVAGKWSTLEVVCHLADFDPILADRMKRVIAEEKPTLSHVLSHGKTVVRLGDPAGGTEAAIWLLALVPGAGVVLVGVGAIALGRAGVLLSALAATAAAAAILVPIGGWRADHTARYPNGVDLIPPSNAASDKVAPGEWEGKARDTALSLQHWTIAIAVAAALVVTALAVRRRWFGRRPAPTPAPPLEGVHAPDATLPPL